MIMTERAFTFLLLQASLCFVSGQGKNILVSVNVKLTKSNHSIVKAAVVYYSQTRYNS